MPFVVGLTGSIGMGKSTTAGFFAEAGAAVWDADAAVHRLYARGNAGAEAIRVLCPEAVGPDGVDRARLARWIAATPENLARVEAVIHPLVAGDRAAFLAAASADVVVLDVPLLLERGVLDDVDLVVVVSAPAHEQRARVLARPGMTEGRSGLLAARQMPDAEKRARADVVIDTTTLAGARQAVQTLMEEIRAGNHARNRARHRDHGA